MADTKVLSRIKPGTIADLGTFEARWDSLIESADTTPEDILELLPTIELLAAQSTAEKLESAVWTGLELFRDRWELRDLLRVAGPLLLRFPKSASIREFVATLYATAYADRPGVANLFEESGIAGGKPPRRALRTLEVCLAMEVGGFLATREGEEVVKVESIDPTTWEAKVRGRAGSKTLSPTELGDGYQAIEKDDYRALRGFDPAQYKKLLHDDPAAVVLGILKAIAKPVSSETLESMLCPRDLTTDQWKKWWTKARSDLKNSPQVRIEGRSPYFLTYQSDRGSPTNESESAFHKARSIEARWSVVEAYLRECKARKEPTDGKLLAKFRDEFQKLAEQTPRHGTGQALTCWLRVGKLGSMLSEPDPYQGAENWFRSSNAPASRLLDLDSADLWVAACDALINARPHDAAEIMAKVLPLAPFAACETISTRLKDLEFPEDRFQELLQGVIADPVRSSEAFFWLWDVPIDPAPGLPDRLSLLSRILRLLNDVQRHDDRIDTATGKRIRARAKSALSARNFERFRAVLENVDAGMASSLRTQVKRISGLGQAVQEDMLKWIQQRFPENTSAPTVPMWKRDDILLVTPQGMAKREAELTELVNVKMRQNAIAIGEAAAHGDLSENSEYKFALEERDLLRARAGQMQSELSIAKILKRDEVTDKQITPGCRATLRRIDDGQSYDLTLLGPWEANIEENIYNYKSPVGQSLMGLARGETTELNVGRLVGKFEVVSIEPAIV